MSFSYRDDMLQADAAFEAEAPDLPSLFAECGRAMFGVMADLSGVRPAETRRLDLEDASLEMLLHRWLSDLVFLKDRDSLLFCAFDVRISAADGPFKLESTCTGEKADPGRHGLGSDVKGVSFYRFSLKFEDSAWKALVVCDL
jgi:SHS2 domain-containing protein